MNSFEAYQTYLAIKRHFEPGSTYDYHRYGGKTSASVNSFEGRKDKLFFMKLAKHPDVINFLVANLSYNPKLYVRNIAYDAACQKRYEERQKFIESMSYSVANQFSVSEPEEFNKMLRAESNEHPMILQKYLVGKLRLETLCVLDDLTNFSRSWEKIIGNDPVVAEVLEKIAKMKPFLTYDKEMVRTTILKKFQ
jgi:hypothetical protein